MGKRKPKPELVEDGTLSPLNLYLPHEWYSPSICRWFYAIKKQPRIGT